MHIYVRGCVRGCVGGEGGSGCDTFSSLARCFSRSLSTRFLSRSSAFSCSRANRSRSFSNFFSSFFFSSSSSISLPFSFCNLAFSSFTRRRSNRSCSALSAFSLRIISSRVFFSSKAFFSRSRSSARRISRAAISFSISLVRSLALITSTAVFACRSLFIVHWHCSSRYM